MNTLYVNAPIQNKEFSPDVCPGKLIPLLAARVLQQASNGDFEQIHLWNNVIAAQQRGMSKSDYEARTAELLADKYRSNVLETVSSDATILTDTDDCFVNWSQTLVESLTESGDLLVDSREVHVCNDCDGVIAHACAEISNGCMSCGTSNTSIRFMPVLITKPQEGSSDSGHEGRTRECIINKRRLMGVSLESVGFPGDVLDPKIGIGLLAVYAAQSKGFDDTQIVAARSSAQHNSQQVYSFIDSARKNIDLPSVSIRSISKAPVEYIGYLRNEGVLTEEKYQELLTDIIPKELVNMKHDMTPQTADRIIFSSRRNKGIAKSIQKCYNII